MDKEKYLPIGSVVKIKGSEKRVMIIGYLPMTKDDKVFDYNACIYPEGLINVNQFIGFNHETIGKVEHMGMESLEQEKFNESIKIIVNDAIKIKKMDFPSENNKKENLNKND